jgi:hypothetical protein
MVSFHRARVFSQKDGSDDGLAPVPGGFPIKVLGDFGVGLDMPGGEFDPVVPPEVFGSTSRTVAMSVSGIP